MEKHISLSLIRQHNTAIISLEDKGIGIPKEELRKIFDKFYQVPAGIAKENRGSGLGLTITKQIIEAHNGQIEVKSEKGQGCTFTISLPISDGKN